MDLAKRLGVDDLDSLLMESARRSWPQWCAAHPELAVVEDLADLPAWTRKATSAQKEPLFARLAALTAYDADAVTALVWLLVPAATKVAADLRDLHPDIDGLVAGQLWIECSRAHELKTSKIAGAIRRRVRREVCAELGVGDLARRRDLTWAQAVPVERIGEFDRAVDDHGSQDEVSRDLIGLEIEAMEAHAIQPLDSCLIHELANAANRLGAPAGRGRQGLTSPAVVAEVAGHIHLSPRAIRRRAAKALDALAEYVRVRDDPERFGVWKAQHPRCTMTPGEELALVITEDEDAHYFRVQDLPPEGWESELLVEPRRPATG